MIRNKNIAVRQQTVNRQSVQAAFKKEIVGGDAINRFSELGMHWDAEIIQPLANDR